MVMKGKGVGNKELRSAKRSNGVVYCALSSCLATVLVPWKMKHLALGGELHGVKVERSHPNGSVLLRGDGHSEVALGAGGSGGIEEGQGTEGKGKGKILMSGAVVRSVYESQDG